LALGVEPLLDIANPIANPPVGELRLGRHIAAIAHTLKCLVGNPEHSAKLGFG
jgi:hypothetical protein